MAQIRPQCRNPPRGMEAPAQQSVLVQLLEPLCIVDVGLATGNGLGVSCVGHDLRVRRQSGAPGPGGLVATLLSPQGRIGNLIQCHRISLRGHRFSPPPPYSNSKGCWCLSDVGREGFDRCASSSCAGFIVYRSSFGSRHGRRGTPKRNRTNPSLYLDDCSRCVPLINGPYRRAAVARR